MSKKCPSCGACQECGTRPNVYTTSGVPSPLQFPGVTYHPANTYPERLYDAQNAWLESH